MGRRKRQTGASMPHALGRRKPSQPPVLGRFSSTATLGCAWVLLAASESTGKSACATEAPITGELTHKSAARRLEHDHYI